MATIRIHTTQNVSLEYEVASLGDRIVAYLIDTLITVAWLVLVGVVIEKVFKLHGDASNWLFLGFGAVPFLFYYLVSEMLFNGQSLGKKARHLRVVRLDGTSPRFGDYLLRWLLRLVDTGLSGGSVAMVTLAVNGRGQRLGDMAAGTTVINLQPKNSQLLDLGAIHTSYQPVFAEAAQLTDHDVALLRQLLDRSTRRQNFLLLNDTAAKVKQLLHLETDMGDEAFLRTVLRDHAHLLQEN